jgi:hypothetical protein
MRLVHPFPHSMPVDWPPDWRRKVYIVEDGDDDVLHVDYENRSFVRPMFPWRAEDLRKAYLSMR